MEIDTLARLFVDADNLRKIYKRNPAYKKAVDYFEASGFDGSVVHTQFALTENQKLMELIIHLAKMEEECLRRHKTLQSGVEFLGNGLTDIYTYGNGPCFILIANRQAVIHLPLNLMFIRGVAEISEFRLSEADVLQKELNLFLKNTKSNNSLESIDELIFLPGECWAPQDGKKFSDLLSVSYPQTKIKTHLPSNHAVWLGYSPKKPERSDFAIVDINRRLLFKSF